VVHAAEQLGVKPEDVSVDFLFDDKTESGPARGVAPTRNARTTSGLQKAIQDPTGACNGLARPLLRLRRALEALG